MPRMTPTAKRAAVDLPETRVPAANAQVSRRRLLDQLSAAPRARLIVVQGPAGYGKTVLLRQYCEQRAAAGDKVAWVRMDAHSADPAEFLRLLCEAARGLRSEEHTSELQSLMRISYAV